jgi:hypothetical protein
MDFFVNLFRSYENDGLRNMGGFGREFSGKKSGQSYLEELRT